jgi:hypothetical protein
VNRKSRESKRRKRGPVPESKKVPKKARKRHPVRAVCGCTSRDGEPKTLFPEREEATRIAGGRMGREGKMWQIYKCPRGAGGFHIGTVRWDPES